MEHRRLNRVRVVLAGGLLLGFGAVATLAAWTEEESATGSVAAPTPTSIVGSTDGVDFRLRPSPPGTLAFGVTPKLVTGHTTYALYSVRTAAASDARFVQLTADSANRTGAGAHLDYGVNTIAGTRCNAATFAAGTVTVAPGSMLSVSPWAMLTADAAGASALNYCFAITLPADLPAGIDHAEAYTAHWTFRTALGESS